MSHPPRIGRRFERLVVLERAEMSPSADGNHTYLCRCDCGNTKTVRWKNLARGGTKSCGCLATEWLAKMQDVKRENREHRAAQFEAYLDGQRAKYVDGVPRAKHPLFNTWRCMLKRCYNPAHDAYRWYGAKGVEVCERWREDFEAFVRDVGPRPSPMHTLDRKEGAKGYEPDNCRWADRYTQHSNKASGSTPVLVHLPGRTAYLSDLCRAHKISRRSVDGDIRKGYQPNVAFLATALRKRMWARYQNGGPAPQYAQCYALAEKILEKGKMPSL